MLADARRGQMKKKAAPSGREAPASAAASRNSATPITATIANAVQNRFTYSPPVPGRICPPWIEPLRPEPVAGKDVNEATSVPIPPPAFG